MQNLDKIFPLHKGITFETNVPDPNKRVAKGKPAPEKPEKPEARVIIKSNGDDGEEVMLVGDRIAQEGLALYARLNSNERAVKKDKTFVKEILYQAAQAGIDVRGGIRDLETSETLYDTYSYQGAFEKSFEVLSFLISKFRADFEKDETAQQLLEEAGIFVEDESGQNLRLVDAEEFKQRNFANPQVRKNFKITVNK